MQRYFVTKEDYDKSIITNNDAFHIIKVLRMKIGSNIIICFNEISFLSEITNIEDNIVYYKTIKQLESNELKTNITLVQGTPKGDKLEDIIMHSTELGVSNIIISNFIRSIAKIDEKKKENKILRYSKIAKEAAEQSHRNKVPNISYDDIKKIDYSKYDLLILLDEETAKVKSNNLKELYNDELNVLFVVGPEGGIDPKEREFFYNNGFKLVSLGKRILRTQTASLAFLSMLSLCCE